MARSRVPVRLAAELQRIAALRQARDEAVRAMERHARVCLACGRLVTATGNYCPEGWALAMERARTRNAWAKRNDNVPANGEQQSLF